MKTLIENQILSDIEKARSGVYEDNRKNRKLGRVGQRYGAEKQPEDGEKTEKKEADPAKRTDSVMKQENKSEFDISRIETPAKGKKKKFEVNGEEFTIEHRALQGMKDGGIVHVYDSKGNRVSSSDYYRGKGNYLDWKIDFDWYLRHRNKNSNHEPVDGEKPKEEQKPEPKESYTRVKFDDVPNSGKVNLKKYLSDKIKNKIDNQANFDKLSDEELSKAEKISIQKFNEDFENSTKSKRAESLYIIMKIKNELEKRKG